MTKLVYCIRTIFEVDSSGGGGGGGGGGEYENYLLFFLFQVSNYTSQEECETNDIQK